MRIINVTINIISHDRFMILKPNIWLIVKCNDGVFFFFTDLNLHLYDVLKNGFI